MTYPSILPPGSTALEKALEQVAASMLDLPELVRAVWSPHDCPIELLPWLAWGFSVDVWDADWPEATKREAVALAIASHRQKGTPAAVRTVIDRVDPLIALVEWFDDQDTMEPFTFRLDLPLIADTDIAYDEALIAQLVRDITTVKPVRAHMQLVFRLFAEANAWLVSGTQMGGVIRLDSAADTASALDPSWALFIQTEDGEPIQFDDGQLLEL